MDCSSNGRGTNQAMILWVLIFLVSVFDSFSRSIPLGSIGTERGDPSNISFINGPKIIAHFLGGGTNLSMTCSTSCKRFEVEGAVGGVVVVVVVSSGTAAGKLIRDVTNAIVSGRLATDITCLAASSKEEELQEASIRAFNDARIST